MDRLLRTALIEHIRNGMTQIAPRMTERSLSATERKRYPIGPVIAHTFRTNNHEYFVCFVPAKRSSSGQFYVELGWKSGDMFPVPDSDASVTSNKDDFAIRLFRLCQRGRAERFWDLFQPEVWDRAHESVQDFYRRTAFTSIDAAIAIDTTGGVTPEYARQQASLVGGDVLRCLQEFGLPYLYAAEHRHLEVAHPP